MNAVNFSEEGFSQSNIVSGASKELLRDPKWRLEEESKSSYEPANIDPVTITRFIGRCRVRNKNGSLLRIIHLPIRVTPARDYYFVRGNGIRQNGIVAGGGLTNRII